MKVALVCAALVAAPAFAAELVAQQGNDTIRLGESACTSEAVLSRLEPRFHSEFRKATAVVQGQTFNACWRMVAKAAHLVYEDGDQGLIPLSDLKPQQTA